MNPARMIPFLTLPQDLSIHKDIVPRPTSIANLEGRSTSYGRPYASVGPFSYQQREGYLVSPLKLGLRRDKQVQSPK